jgi:hypothetical protein
LLIAKYTLFFYLLTKNYYNVVVLLAFAVFVFFGLTVEASAANMFSISVSKSHVDWLVAAGAFSADPLLTTADSATSSRSLAILGAAGILSAGARFAGAGAPSPPPPSFTQSPSPPCSLARDGQTSPHRPRIVVSRSTCPPLSPSPHANNFVLGPPVINTHKGREGGNKEKCTKNRERRKERGKKGKGKKRGGGGGGFFSFEERKERERKEEEEEEEEEEDLFVFNDTIKGPRATAVKPFFSPPSFHTPSLFPAFISVWWSD